MPSKVNLQQCVCTGSEEDGHAHMNAYIYTETTTKPLVKIKQVPFESVPQI